MLYEVAFAFGALKEAFSIYTTLPRNRVDEHASVVGNISAGVLVIENDAKATDPSDLFSPELEVNYSMQLAIANYDCIINFI